MSHLQKAFYNESFSLVKKPLKIIFPIFSLIFLFSCHITDHQSQKRESFPRSIEKIVVVGFKVALSEGENPGLFRCPICGATFMAETVAETIAKEMTADLFNYLKEIEKYSLITPGQARGVCSTIFSENVTLDIIEILKETGKSFSSDAVLFGYIYRWRERVGTKYGVDSPASVAFDLHLVSTDNGSILWKGSFNKTQVSLLENLLDLSTFIRSGGKWLTARELAQIGLEKLIRKACHQF